MELGLLANVLAAVAAAIGIYRDRRRGWLLGAAVAAISVALYLVQETVGLPGLQKTRLEPSRLVALIVEGVFLLLAGLQLVRVRSRAVGDAGGARRVGRP